MTADRTEHDLRELLARESYDVAAPEEFLGRLDGGRPARRLPSVLWAVAAAAVVLLLATGRFAFADHGAPVTAAAPSTQHLSLRSVPYLQVTAADDLGDREVLQVSYVPGEQASYDGGAVTLYAAGVFRPSAFLARAVAVGNAYYGSYPYTGDWAPVTTLAWPLGDGRWVTVQNFHGTDYLNASTIRALEVRVAAEVIVR